jgi:hypothetical protein
MSHKQELFGTRHHLVPLYAAVISILGDQPSIGPEGLRASRSLLTCMAWSGLSFVHRRRHGEPRARPWVDGPPCDRAECGGGCTCCRDGGDDGRARRGPRSEWATTAQEAGGRGWRGWMRVRLLQGRVEEPHMPGESPSWSHLVYNPSAGLQLTQLAENHCDTHRHRHTHARTHIHTHTRTHTHTHDCISSHVG